MNDKINTSIRAVLLVIACTGLATGAEKKPWSWDTEAGYVKITGNSRSETAQFKSAFKRKWQHSALTLKGSHVSATQDDTQNAESYAASEKIDRSISKHLYVFELGEWEKDRFAGIDNRYSGQLGLGYMIIKQKPHLLDSELGVGYTGEEYINGTDDAFTSARAFAQYVYTISETSDFSQECEYLRSFEQSNDYRVNAVTAVSASINSYLALKISYTVKYDHRPISGFKKTDTIVSSALILKI
ncbi:MAG: DUF481 domain-containing protein [Elusimicrobia bacterium]|nr:DUF481 domain-containing protein [Elusimicrobiota bacterium]MBD3412537.1 DUF481 domain-containing protein [Elusimicrobiota bacterium]